MNVIEVVKFYYSKFLSNVMNNKFINITKLIEDYSFIRKWKNRNIEYGAVVIEILEIEAISFLQELYVEESKQLVEKLNSIGFVPITQYPEETHFKTFSTMMYNKKYNVAISMYESEYKNPIHMAHTLVEAAKLNDESQFPVFITAINILSNK